VATAYKVLGQNAPTAATDTSLYTVPASTNTVVSNINICNRDVGSADYVSIAIRISGASLAVKQYLVYQEILAPASVYNFTAGITLSATDVITVNSLLGTSTFQAFGSEIS
jgi:hypothetical protein